MTGNIGYQLPGLIPLRRAGDGTDAGPGLGHRATTGTARSPSPSCPYVENPSSGIIVAANNQVIGVAVPATSSARRTPTAGAARRSTTASPTSDGLTADTGEQIFYDERLRFAADLVPELLRVRVDDGFVREGQQTLVGWDYTMTSDSAAAAYFAIVTHDLKKLVLADQLRARAVAAGRGPVVRRPRPPADASRTTRGGTTRRRRRSSTATTSCWPR